jgi:putative FmdB family regulatory protein
MPTYGYNCTMCNHGFTKQRGMNDPEDNTCPLCDNPSQRDYSIGRVKFKGAGFYTTDKAE